MTSAQHWLIGILLLLLGVWLLWVWFGFEPDLTKNPRSLQFASSAAYADFLTLGKPNLEARRLRYLKQVEHPIFVEFVKLGFRQLVADDLQFELVTDKLAFTVIALTGTNGERMLVACSQDSLRKNPTWTNEFGHLCQINQVGGFFIHLGVTNRAQAVRLSWAYSIHLLSGSRLIHLLTRQDDRLAWLFHVDGNKPIYAHISPYNHLTSYIMQSSELTRNRPYRVWLFRLVVIVLFCLLGGVSIAHFIVHVCAKQHPVPPAKRSVQQLYRLPLHS